MHVFTYGSLMFPAVWQRVVRGSYRAVPALLSGFARYAVAGEIYPGMVPHKDSAVNGVLYLDVADADLLILDAFEGSEYRRDEVAVSVADDRKLIAATYVFVAAGRLTQQAWEPEAFSVPHFIDACCRDA